MSLRLEYAALSETGKVRRRNEDAWLAEPAGGLFVLADGMGGAFAGELAARAVVETLPPLIRQKLGAGGRLRTDAESRCAEALSELSRGLTEMTKGRPGLEGMGATALLLLVRGRAALLAHLGDSRAYRLGPAGLERLTRDHSLAQILLDSGEITPREAAEHPARNHLTRFVGMAGEPLPETRRIALRPGDRLLLCTDGLTGMIGEEELEALWREAPDPRGSCERLVAAALAAGGEDNVTVLALAFFEGGGPGSTGRGGHGVLPRSRSRTSLRARRERPAGG